MINWEHLQSWIRFPKGYRGFQASLISVFRFVYGLQSPFHLSFTLSIFPQDLFHFKGFLCLSLTFHWRSSWKALWISTEFLVLCIFSQSSAHIVFCQTFSRAILNIWQHVISLLFMSCRASSSSPNAQKIELQRLMKEALDATLYTDLRSDAELRNGLHEVMRNKYLLRLSVEELILHVYQGYCHMEENNIILLPLFMIIFSSGLEVLWGKDSSSCVYDFYCSFYCSNMLILWVV